MDVSGMKVDELKAELSKRSLPVSGRKADLVSRLQMALDDEEFGLSLDTPTGGPAPAFPEPVAAAKPVEEPAEEPAPVPTPAAPVDPVDPGPEVAVAAEPAAPVAAPVAEAKETGGGGTDIEKKITERAKRFGVVTKEATVVKSASAIEARAARFGLKDESKKAAAKTSKAGKLRMELPPQDAAKLEARKKRFASAEDQKIAARAARFGA